jgi:hypothetical protein
MSPLAGALFSGGKSRRRESKKGGKSARKSARRTQRKGGRKAKKN